MKRPNIPIGCAAVLLAAAAAALAAQAAHVKIGVALTYSGVGAQLGTQIDRGIEPLHQGKTPPHSAGTP